MGGLEPRLKKYIYRQHTNDKGGMIKKNVTISKKDENMVICLCNSALTLIK